MKNNELELIEFKIDENYGDIPVISIVNDPAIEKTFQLFNSLKHYNFQITDKQEITGIAMTPNKPILRINEKTKEYYNCWFSEDTIRKCSEIFLKNSNHTKANFNHGKEFSDDLFISESWIVADPANDKLNALGFKDINKGDWAITYKVTSTDLWNSIKASDFTGFSIEGFFSMFEKIDEKEKMIYNIVKSNLSDFDKEDLIRKIINTL